MKSKIVAYLLMGLFCMAFDCQNDRPLTEEDVKACTEGQTPPWIDDVIREMKPHDYGGEIIRYRYKDEYVFLVNPCTRHCNDFITYVYNCRHEEICKFGGFAGFNTCPDFSTGATDEKVIWTN